MREIISMDFAVDRNIVVFSIMKGRSLRLAYGFCNHRNDTNYSGFSTCNSPVKA